MNDFSDLEAELKRLKPADVSPRLEARIERALETGDAPATAGLLRKRRSFRINWLALGLGLGAAAALLVLARTSFDDGTPPKQMFAAITPAPRVSTAVLPNEYVPAAVTNVVYDRQDDGLVYSDESAEPSRRLRRKTRETMQWQNPNTGASLRVSYPVEEVVLIPISGQ